MSEWYYARNGAQSGPVSFEQLVEIARGGGLDPLKDLVWNSTMKDWLTAGQVPGIFTTPTNPAAPTADPSNPYATPDSTWSEVAQITAGEALEEIIPGSEPIDVGGCVKRGFDLTCRHFGMILLMGIVYFGVTIGASVLLGLIDKALGWGQFQPDAATSVSAYSDGVHYQQNGSALNIIVSQLLSILLSLGVTRFGLNLVSGREYSIGMLFSGGKSSCPRSEPRSFTD